MKSTLKRILAMASITESMMHEHSMVGFKEPCNPIYHPTKSQKIKRKQFLARKHN
jgi:hypothetical protein